MPGASGVRWADGAWQGGRDLWEGWDESSLLGGRNLQREQGWFKVNVVDSRSSSTSNIPLRCVVTQHNMGCGRYDLANTLTKVLIFHMPGCYTHTHLKLCVSSKALCGITDPRKCTELWGVFNYYPNRSYGDCGAQNGTWCTDGKYQKASPGHKYYALCASTIGKPCHLSGKVLKNNFVFFQPFSNRDSKIGFTL